MIQLAFHAKTGSGREMASALQVPYWIEKQVGITLSVIYVAVETGPNKFSIDVGVVMFTHCLLGRVQCGFDG